jgi:hypothetical protein
MHGIHAVFLVHLARPCRRRRDCRLTLPAQETMNTRRAVLHCRVMDEDKVRKWVHDLNNRVGMVLANAELMQLEKLPPKAFERTKLIEEKTLEIRQLIREMTDHLLE